MPIRSRSHQLEDRSRIAFRAALPRPWVFRDKTPDYGIDGEVEIFDEHGGSTGLQALVQLKANEKSTTAPQVSYKVEWIKYYLSLDIPVLLVLWVEETNEFLWKWANQVDLFYAKKGAKSLSVSFTNKWTSSTPFEIERTLSFRRDVRAKRVPLPISCSMTGLVDDTLRAEAKRLFAYAPRLITYSDSDAQVFCEIRDDEAAFWLQGYQGMVIHNWSKKADAIKPRKVVCGLIFALALHGLVDLGAQVWAQVPGLDEAIDDLDFTGYAMKVLALAGAAIPLRELVQSLLRRGRDDLASLPLQMLYASAPPHRQVELGTLLVTVYQAIANDTNPIAKSNGYYNLARHFERSNRKEARQYFEAAIRNSDFYHTKSYFWREFGGFLFSNHRYHAALQCYSYSLIELGDDSVRLHYADALMHTGQFARALDAFKVVAETPIDMSLPMDKGIELATRRAEAMVKCRALTFSIAELGITSQSRDSRSARAAFDLEGGLDEIIQRMHRSLRVDALGVNAWFNLGYTYSQKGETESAMLSYLMAGTAGTEDDEAWWNALARAIELQSDVLHPLLEYLHLQRGDEFVRYLAEASNKETDGRRRKFMSELVALLSSNLPDNTSTEIRVFKDEKNWRSVKIGKK